MNTLNNFDTEKKAAAGAARYNLLRTAQAILAKSGLDWKEQHRTCWCSRSLKRGDETVDVYRNEARDGASFAGLNRCGNLHTCPVCAAKVAELRRKQLSAGMVNHCDNGGWAYLLTFTFPHTSDEKLQDLLKRFDKARQRFQNSKAWKAFKKEAGVIGVVNSLEFTVSQENGWHPHVHMLAFTKSKKAFGEGQPVNNQGDLDSLRIQELKLLWVQVLFKCGLGEQAKLTDMMNHALNVRGGEKAAEYIAKFGRDEKWGASSELARSHAKTGAAGEKWGVLHFTPFQLLVWAGEGDAWAIHRFREFGEAVEGKRALVWSPKLKAALQVEDVDEETWIENDEPQPEQVLVGSLSSEQFAVLQSRKCVAQFLEYAATCANDQVDIDDFIDGVRQLDKIASGSLLAKREFSGGKLVIFT
ncbi:MAG: hypothetical protein EPO42_13310 [Gallionellaceae bacterium]|nr:MAG: hypothetical protein EPO42_13310 [Gallionellaceae bacterium]